MKTDLNTQHISTRPLRRDDYDQIVHLLQESIPLAPVGFNWDIRRWEGKCWYDQDSNGDPNWHLNSQVWLTDNAQIIGLAHPDGPGYPYLEVHPDYRHLEMEMIIWAEENLTEAKLDTGRQIHFFVFEYDAHRQRLLSERGYEKMNYGGVTRQLRFGHMPLPQPELSAGYTLRTTNPEDPNDAQQIANLLNVAFKRTFHNAGEYQQFTRRAICFHQSSYSLAVAPDVVILPPMWEFLMMRKTGAACLNRSALTQSISKKGWRRRSCKKGYYALSNGGRRRWWWRRGRSRPTGCIPVWGSRRFIRGMSGSVSGHECDYLTRRQNDRTRAKNSRLCPSLKMPHLPNCPARNVGYKPFSTPTWTMCRISLPDIR